MNVLRKRFLIGAAVIITISIVGATLTMDFDPGGNPSFKFLLYVIFFGSISSTGFLSSSLSCFRSSSRLRK